MYTFNSTFDELHGVLFPANSSATFLSTGLGSYKKNHSSELNLSEPALLISDDLWIELWKTSGNGNEMTFQEASFSVEFTMSIYRPIGGRSSSLIFTIIPNGFPYNNRSLLFADQLFSSRDTSESIVIMNTTDLADNIFIIIASECEMILINVTFFCLEIISIESRPDHSTIYNYTFSIDYNHFGHNMTVQVSVVLGDGQEQKSSGSKSGINFTNIYSQFGLFSFSSSMGQLFQLHTWNSTVDRLSDELGDSHEKKDTTFIILSSVIGSAAVTVATAAAVYCYFNSKYRGWKMELDQLAKSMQQLPGVPTQFSFSDIRRATNNFHETTQLGRGGFGSVYRCSLPGPKKGETLEVAVKKFSRDDNRRYEDFLAEVSVINRLRHKNIVPLVGWSYNKGEPLLVYEYMPNGSLDQHLFRRSGANQQQPTPISTWDTRYNMVKDIATGLQYVHHEYEPRVLHRDIKANNIMVDSGFQGRLGDFGLACVVANGKEPYTDIGAPGTLGFRAPEYIHSGKATTKSDIFAFGVLVLEIVTGKMAVDAQHCHLTDWVWNLHKEGRLPDAIDPTLTTEFHTSDAKRLLLLGLACSQPNPSDRPTMLKALQIITKSEPLPDVPLKKPRFVWPPEEEQTVISDYSYNTEQSSLGVHQTIGIEMSEAGHASSSENGGNVFVHTFSGWSYSKGEPLLVYEYMPNGSLDQHLFCRNGGNQQQPTPISTWDTRYNMVKDIATGLHYVHHEYEPRVLHRDIKANNIMIDSGFQGCLGDFGLACVVANGKESYTDIGAPGTLGFRVPEYIHSGKATTKSDIFAFGVLVLEIVTGKVAIDAQHHHHTDWVWHLHKEGRLPDAIDPTLTTEFEASDAKRLLLLGLACSQPNPSDRPTMVKALQIITKSEPPPDVPLEKPRFVWPPEEEQTVIFDYSYSTEQSSLGVHQTIGIEMSEAVQASSSENGGNGLHHRPIARPSVNRSSSPFITLQRSD
nr:unnamed protein product [Digitaria exilis]